ncbi:MAG TPA: hypothetical protein VGS01_13720 [Candidatus Limnocylindria bacterium]|jgi:hypothetical protein|nr:hypothetical protein [Candidatus Limnocylindria bacterium]
MAEKKQENPLTRTVKEGGETAQATVKEAGKLAGDAMTSAGKTVESGERAVTGVVSEGLDDVDEIGSQGGSMAKKAAENIAATPHDVAKSAWTGEPESEKKKK